MIVDEEKECFILKHLNGNQIKKIVTILKEYFQGSSEKRNRHQKIFDIKLI